MNRSLLFRVLPLLVLFFVAACGETSQTPSTTDSAQANTAHVDSINVDALLDEPEAAGFETVADTIGDDLLGALRPGEPASYLAWRKGFFYTEPGVYKTLASVGQPCAGGSPSCQRALDSLDPGHSTILYAPPAFHAYSYLAVSRGDSAFAVTSPEEAAEFLSPIDAAAEAALLLMFEGPTPSPPDYVRAGPGDTFTALADVRVQDCPIGYQALLIRVFTDGRTETIGRGRLRQDGRACI